MAFQQQYYHTHHQAPIRFSCPNPSPLSLYQAQASTSGRMVGDDLVSQIIYNQNIEIDAMIRLQNERLRLGLEEARKKQCRSLIATLEQRLMKKLKEKEEELEAASLKNAELEEQIRQMAAENEIWFKVATLRASLEQVLVQNQISNGAVKEEEGYGDSDGFGREDDAQSCCFGGGEDEEERRVDGAVRMAVCCKVCGDKDVSVLLLPCRHLCLCKDCESKTDTCPVCHVSKKVCLQIFLS